MAPAGEEAAALVDAARAFVGVVSGSPTPARYPVDGAMIDHWCEALGDANPVYRDAAMAAATRHRGIVAPPAMLGSWTLDVSAGPSGSPRDGVLERLDAAGYTAVVATNYEQEYHRELRLGDRLTETILIEDLSEEKATALGAGYFVTVRHDYRDLDGELVGAARMRLLKFKPPDRPRAAGTGGAGAAARPRPPVNRDNAFFWEGVAQGELRIQRCTGCGTLRHPPRPMCGDCRSTAWDHVVSGGQGSVYSYAVHHHPPLPGIETPHVIVLVELLEGIRLVSSLAGVDPADARVGLPVEVVFERVADDLTLPLFRPRSEA